MPSIVTRFAPSPTGYLHIGGARTALFNWLYAKANNGKFLLRIEDTDTKRSTQAAIDAILYSMEWLGLNADEPPIYQSKNIQRHTDIANELIKNGKAYYCYTLLEELQQQREQAKQQGQHFKFISPWRDGSKQPPEGIKPVIRLKADTQGEIIINDLVQGQVKINATELDDMIILRSDGTPTYMLAVVVDDHDMGVTHIIRGDDHLTNSFRQLQIYKAMGWNMPQFSHIPLIHGADGAKLSKRHGALGVEEYQKQGYLPEAVLNYLLRLGWAHGDEEIIPLDKAIQLFSFDGVGKSPSRFDTDKLNHLNSVYIKQISDDKLVELIKPLVEQLINNSLNDASITRLTKGMAGLKERSSNLNDLAKSCLFYINADFDLDGKEQAILDEFDSNIKQQLVELFSSISDWNKDNIEVSFKQFLADNNYKFGQIGKPLRILLTGTLQSPAIFEVLDVLGQDEVLKRLA